MYLTDIVDAKKANLPVGNAVIAINLLLISGGDRL